MMPMTKRREGQEPWPKRPDGMPYGPLYGKKRKPGEYWPGAHHRKQRQRFLVLVTDEEGCGTQKEADEVMTALGLWSDVYGHPPPDVLRRWLDTYLEEGEEIPPEVRRSVLIQFHAYERTHLRRAVKSAAETFEHVSRELRQDKLDPKLSVRLKYAADALGFLSRVAQEGRPDSAPETVQIGRVTLNMGRPPQPPQLAQGRPAVEPAAKPAAEPVEAEFRHVDPEDSPPA